jgi:hypothetical protein
MFARGEMKAVAEPAMESNARPLDGTGPGWSEGGGFHLVRRAFCAFCAFCG